MKLTNYSALIVFVILFAQISTIILQSKAQSPEQGNIIFIRKTVADTFAIDYQTEQQTPAHNGRCSRYSGQLNYLARFNGQNPDRLEFIELSTGTIVATLPWQAEWGNDFIGLPCLASSWLDENTFTLARADDPNIVYEINWQTGTISAPYQPVRVNNTPQRVPSSEVRPVYSPSGQFVVYNRCDTPECDVSASFVIYDISQQLVVAELANSISDFRQGIIPEAILSWSHDDRYLVHEAWIEQGYNVIYDLNQGAYLDLGVVSDDLAKISPNVGGVKWAPDNRRMAHPVKGTSELGYDFDFGIIVIDVQSKSYEIFEVPEANMPRSSVVFEWAPSGDALLFADSNRDMYRLNLDDSSLDFITSDVDFISAWYPATPAPSVSSLSYLPSDQPLSDGTTINLESNLTIRANTSPATVGSVVFSDGTNTIVDNEAPYEFPITSAGSYTLTATPYSEADGGGTAGIPLMVTFTVVEGQSTADFTLTPIDYDDE